MEDLLAYVKTHTYIGGCPCGDCIPENLQIKKEKISHATSLIFFEVAIKQAPSSETLRELIEHTQIIEECEFDLFDGREHNSYELGTLFSNNSEMTLRFMGLCYLTGLFQLITPDHIFSEIHGVTKDMKLNLATLGFISIVVRQ